MTSPEIHIKCQPISESSNHLLTPLQFIIYSQDHPGYQLFLFLSKLVHFFILQSSQFKSYHFFRFSKPTITAHSTDSPRGQLLGMNSTKIYLLTSRYIHVLTPSFPFPTKQSVTFQIFHLCSWLHSFPHLRFCSIFLL